MNESFRFGDDSTPVACFVLGTIGGIEQRRKAGIASGFSRSLNKNPF